MLSLNKCNGDKVEIQYEDSQDELIRAIVTSVTLMVVNIQFVQQTQ